MTAKCAKSWDCIITEDADQKQSNFPDQRTQNMGKYRVRPSLFPGCPPFLTFVSPGEEYEDGDEYMEELGMPFMAPIGTSPPILECFQRFGFKFLEVSFTTNTIIKLDKIFTVVKS